MITPMLGNRRILRIPDEMQLLVIPQSEPRPGKLKRRARQRLEPQDIAIEDDAAIHVGHMDRNVIELEGSHQRLSCSRGAARSSGRSLAATAPAERGNAWKREPALGYRRRG